MIIDRSTSLLEVPIKAGLISPSSASQVSSLLLSGDESNLEYKNIALFIEVLNTAMKLNVISQDKAITLLVKAINAGIHKSENASTWCLSNLLNNCIYDRTITMDDAKQIEVIEASLKTKYYKPETSNEDSSESDSYSSSSYSESNSSSEHPYPSVER